MHVGWGGATRGCGAAPRLAHPCPGAQEAPPNPHSWSRCTSPGLPAPPKAERAGPQALTHSTGAQPSSLPPSPAPLPRVSSTP